MGEIDNIHKELNKLAKKYAEDAEIFIESVTFRWGSYIGSPGKILEAIEVQTSSTEVWGG